MASVIVRLGMIGCAARGCDGAAVVVTAGVLLHRARSLACFCALNKHTRHRWKWLKTQEHAKAIDGAWRLQALAILFGSQLAPTGEFHERRVSGVGIGSQKDDAGASLQRAARASRRSAHAAAPVPLQSSHPRKKPPPSRRTA